MSPLSRPERIEIALRVVPKLDRPTVERIFAVEFRRHDRRPVVADTEQRSRRISTTEARLLRIAEVMETTGLSAFDAALTLAIARLRTRGAYADTVAYGYAFPGEGAKNEAWEAVFASPLPIQWAKAADLMVPRAFQERPGGKDDERGATWQPNQDDRIRLLRFLAGGGMPPYLGYTGLTSGSGDWPGTPPGRAR